MDTFFLIIIILVLVAILFFLGIKYIKLKKENKQYETNYKPIIDLEKAINNKEETLTKLQHDIDELSHKYLNAKSIYEELQSEIRIYQDDLELIDFGVYEPHFDFDSSAKYKDQLTQNKEEQKNLIKYEKAAICKTNWKVGNSEKKGEMMTKRSIKLTLRAFNGECDSLISKVKWNNIDQIEQRISKVSLAIDKVNKSNDIHFTEEYVKLKIDEARLTHEFMMKKHEEKEEQRRIREQMREEEKAIREIEKAKKDAENEESRYEKALAQAQKELKKANGKELLELNGKIANLQKELMEAKEAKERAISRAQLTKSGHVYIISNLGSFGEDVYKIGMTRRLEPMDRVKELGDASVPFQFDVHAMIYSENAPELENMLHKEFNSKRVNMINTRKEYFKVSLDEIESKLRTLYNEELEFTKIAEAREYRETKAKLNKLNRGTSIVKKATSFPESIV